MTDRPTDFRPSHGGDGAAPPLQVVVTLEDPSTLTVEVRGELDLATAPIVERHLEPFRSLPTGDGHRRRVVYELRHLAFIDAAGLDALMRAGSNGPNRIEFREPSRPVRRLLALVGLEWMIEASSRETAS